MRIPRIAETEIPPDPISVPARVLCRFRLMALAAAFLLIATERSFRIGPLANPTPLQSAILNDWLKE